MSVTLGYLSLFTMVTGDSSRWEALQDAFGTFNKMLSWEKKLGENRSEILFFIDRRNH